MKVRMMRKKKMKDQIVNTATDNDEMSDSDDISNGNDKETSKDDESISSE